MLGKERERDYMKREKGRGNPLKTTDAAHYQQEKT
jgi:hypothetical protein